MSPRGEQCSQATGRGFDPHRPLQRLQGVRADAPVQAKIKSRLIADLDPDDWSLPPKPKWMRWRTYNKHVERFDAYEAILCSGVAELLAKFLAK
jgi:hypothetical protein